MTVPSYKCICDTNIWVRVCLGKIHERYIENFSNIGIADVVKNEILKWKENEGRFQDISTLFCEYENRDLFVIDLEELDPILKKIIERELARWGFSDLDNKSKTINDLGEFVSLLYAYHLEVPYIHTHDMNFCETIQFDDLYAEYKGITMITWNELSEHITFDYTERMSLNKLVEAESKIMNSQFKQIKQEQLLDDKLNQLQQHFSYR